MPDDPLGQRGYCGFRWRYTGPLEEAKRLFPDSKEVQEFPSERRYVVRIPVNPDEVDEREPPAD